MRVIVVAAMLALLTASAGQAQINGTLRSPADRPPSPFGTATRGPSPGAWDDIADTDARIDKGRDTGQLTGSQARRLDRQNGAVAGLADRFGRDGLSPSEARELEVRSRALTDQVNLRRLGAGAPAAKRKH